MERFLGKPQERQEINFHARTLATSNVSQNKMILWKKCKKIEKAKKSKTQKFFALKLMKNKNRFVCKNSMKTRNA